MLRLRQTLSGMELYRAHGRVVVLVDEYDKPILDTLFDLERAETFRAVLRGFYTQIKANDEYIRFVFMMGITKFTKTGVFSAMNNLRDLSMNDDYATMLGYTDEELKHYFARSLLTRAAPRILSPTTTKRSPLYLTTSTSARSENTPRLTAQSS